MVCGRGHGCTYIASSPASAAAAAGSGHCIRGDSNKGDVGQSSSAAGTSKFLCWYMFSAFTCLFFSDSSVALDAENERTDKCTAANVKITKVCNFSLNAVPESGVDPWKLLCAFAYLFCGLFFFCQSVTSSLYAIGKCDVSIHVAIYASHFLFASIIHWKIPWESFKKDYPGIKVII